MIVGMLSLFLAMRRLTWLVVLVPSLPVKRVSATILLTLNSDWAFVLSRKMKLQKDMTNMMVISAVDLNLCGGYMRGEQCI